MINNNNNKTDEDDNDNDNNNNVILKLHKISCLWWYEFCVVYLLIIYDKWTKKMESLIINKCGCN